ncbi:hypothetical protein QPK87_36010 [Kamptonema cortianum]|nr:hypothetical protein [Kamptonema cortianum]
MAGATPCAVAQSSANVDQLVAKIIRAEEENDRKSSHYVYEETITIEKLDKNGNIKKSRTKKFLVVSNPGITYELTSLADSGEKILVAGRAFTPPGSASVAVKGSSTASVQEGGPQPHRVKNTPLQYSESIQMSELARRYEFTYGGEEKIGSHDCYVLHFAPSKKIKPRSRIQKVLNHLTGKLWIDKQDHMIKACQASLDKSLSMAGPFATLRSLEINYQGIKLPGKVWMPSELSLQTTSRVFMGKSSQRQVARMSGYRQMTAEEIQALK